MTYNNIDDEEDYPPLEDADIDDFSSNASAATDTSESVSIESDGETGGGQIRRVDGHRHQHHRDNQQHHQDLMVITKLNQMMAVGITEDSDEDDDEDDDDDDDDDDGGGNESDLVEENEDGLTGDYKRRRGSLRDGVDGEYGSEREPIIVPLKTGSDHGDSNGQVSPSTSPVRPLGRRTGLSREVALERNAVRRQSSNDMLEAMQLAIQGHHSNNNGGSEFSRRPPLRTKSGERLASLHDSADVADEGATDSTARRRPPPRTKSGNMVMMRRASRTLVTAEESTGDDIDKTVSVDGDGDYTDSTPCRRPPPRTKSGSMVMMRRASRTLVTAEESTGDDDIDKTVSLDGDGDYTDSTARRRPPPRTKSGSVAMIRMASRTSVIAEESTGDDIDKTVSLDGDGDYPQGLPEDGRQPSPDDVFMSPTARRRALRAGADRDSALKRNAARRQKSSEMLGAMREATRMAPGRSQSSTAAFQRRAPKATKSALTNEFMGGDGGAAEAAAGGGDDDVGKRPPLFRQGSSLNDPVRRAPPRTKSGGIRPVPIRRAPERTKSGSLSEPIPVLES